MITAELYIHLEETIDDEAVWWAESPNVPGFTAAAGSLAELRDLSVAALEDALGGPVRIAERLDADDSVTFSGPDIATRAVAWLLSDDDDA